jgi:hypothetical protein
MGTSRKTRMRPLLATLTVLSMAAACSSISNTAHWSHCQKIADEHALMMEEIARYIQNGAKVVPAYDDGPPAVARELLEYHTQLRWKYRLAAWRPWQDIPPDPPIPLLTSPGGGR